MEIEKIKFVNITGNIASGATTLCQKLCEYFGWLPSYSQAHESPFLKDLYDNNGSFAFQNQPYIITQSFTQQSHLVFEKQTVCQDYTIYEHNSVYSRCMLQLGDINSNELALLEEVFDILHQSCERRRPDLLIYSMADPDTLATRVAKRCRAVERNVKRDYLEILGKHFDSFVEEWNMCPVLRVDSSKLNVSSDDEMKKLETGIKELN